MSTIITITESRSMPGNFKIKSSANKDKRGGVFEREAYGCAAAVAEAMSLALDASGGYMIFGPQKALDMIPADLRNK